MSDTKKSPKTPLDAFRSLGVDIEPDSDQMARGTCPFCDKANHFYLRYHKKVQGNNGRWSAPGHWTCHACQLSGGIPTFLTHLIEYSLSATTKDDYTDLWRKKRIPPAVAKICHVCRSLTNGHWLIPTYLKDEKTDKFKVSNIHHWWESKNKLLGTTTLPTNLLGRQFLSDTQSKPLWIAEGHWDWLIMEHLFRRTKLRESVDLIGVPGAGAFQSDWLNILVKRPEVNIVFDNDHPKTLRSGKVIQPGLDGVKRITHLITSMDDDERPTSTQYVQWPEELDDGFDIRDLYTSNYQESKR